MKRIICLVLALAMCFAFSGCGQEEKCVHEFEAAAEGNVVTLKCRLCGETASAEVELPKETVTVEKEVIREVEVPVEKVVVKEKVVEKEVERIVEVPVYASVAEQMNAENYKLLLYYLNNYDKLDFLKGYISENYYKDVDEQALMEGAYKGMVEALEDKYSVYNPPSKTEEYSNALNKSYSGIGIMIYEDESGNGIIDSVSIGSPAESAGILPGDIIATVSGISMLGQGISVIATSVRGEAGTTVTLEVIRGSETAAFTVQRGQIAESTVSAGILLNGIGYIEMTGFNEITARELSLALSQLEENGIESFILDLRGNPGGSVDACVAAADLLIDDGVLIKVENRTESFEYTLTSGRTKMNYVVLCNEKTASSAEILCAGIQDNNEGIILGTKTYGKGVIQMFTPLTDGSSISLLEYQYFSPKGNPIHNVGITPDYVVELTKDCYNEKGELVNDAQFVKAVELLTE